MLLTFKTVDQVIFKIDVDPAEKIKSLKERIQNDRGCEYIAEGMKLLFAGKILDDDKTIGDYSISDKSFIVIVVPRPKTLGKECSKKSRSSQAQTPVISTIPENNPFSFDAHFSTPNPPLSHSYSREQYPRSGNSSDNEASTASQGKAFQSQVSSDSGQPGRSSKRQSFRSNASSENNSRRSALTRGGVATPDIVAGSSGINNSPPLESYATRETDMVMSPPQSSDEQWKNQEVSKWLEKHVVEEPASELENSSTVDETMVENVRKIVAMGFEREQAEVALNASFNSVEGAVEYLCTNTPPASAQPEARVPAFAWIPPVVQRYPSMVRSRTDLDDPLEFLKRNEDFQFLRLEVHKNPDLLTSSLESFRSSHSELEPVLQAYEDRLVELLTEPIENSPSLASLAVVMDTQSPVTDVAPLDLKESDETPAETSQQSLDPVRSLSSDVDERLDPCQDPVQSASADTDRLLDLPVASHCWTSSSPDLSSIERRIPPVGEESNASGIKTPLEEEDVDDKHVGAEDEEKLSEELIRALLQQDQEEEERLEAERRVAGSAEEVSWNDAESMASSIAGGVGGMGGSTGGGRGGRGGIGGLGGGRTLEDRGYVRVTMEEKQAIDRLKALGFSEERVVQVYLACDKNEEMAANILLDKD